MRYGQPYWLTTKPRTDAPTVTKTRIVVKNELASLTRDSRLLRRSNHLSELSTIDLRLNCISCRRRVSSEEFNVKTVPLVAIRETKLSWSANKGNVPSIRLADTRAQPAYTILFSQMRIKGYGALRSPITRCAGLLLPSLNVHADHDERQGERPFPNEAGQLDEREQIGREPRCKKVCEPVAQVAQTPIAIRTPTIRGRKVDLNTRYPIESREACTPELATAGLQS